MLPVDSFLVFLYKFCFGVLFRPPHWLSGKGVYLESSTPRFDSRFGCVARSSCANDLKIGNPVATLPDAWRYRVSTGTGWPGANILWLDEIESLSATSVSVWQHLQLTKQIGS